MVVDLKQTTKPYLFTNNLKEEIDQYEVFQKERNSCTKYRLISTIKPYCTNVLFNPVTEIVRYDDNGVPEIVVDYKTIEDKENENPYKANLDVEVYGNEEPNRLDMIRNTEYSQESVNYEYFPGYDIFNNHLLRNKTFKIVNPLSNVDKLDKKKKKDFNTIFDFARRFDGEIIKFNGRKSIDKIIIDGDNIDKRLYDREDIYDVNDAINYRLTEENGWVGFVNKTTVISKKKEGNKWVDEDFNHIINSKESCDFIDMYPDRTLYSFNPKYNPYLHRPEYNWNIYLTYPFKNFYQHELIKDGVLNAVLIQEMSYVTGITGQDTILFKTYIKHNLSGGSSINLYYKEKDKDEYKVIKGIVISGVGDLEKNNEDFFFYTTDTKIINELNLIEKNIIDDYVFRYKNVVNDYESEYYIRLFRKIPNLMKSDKIKNEDLINKDTLEVYIDNCDSEFDKEMYRLAFSSTIYNDNNTQITFTDGIEIENLLDNRGRPLTNLYLTIIKNNKGNHIWYEGEINENNVKEVEFSHCFSDISYGFELFNDENSDVRKHARLSDVRTLHTSEIEGIAGMKIGDVDYYSVKDEDICEFGWAFLDKSIIGKDKDKKNIVENDDILFVGDIVEFNSTVCEEVILSEGQFRFNSYLRDNPNVVKYNYTIDVMKTDDYDAAGFDIKDIPSDNVADLFHPEGYYYKAHYPIQVREFGELNQASHFDLRISSVKKVNIANKVCAVVKTTLPHKLTTTDTVLICVDEQDKVMMMQPIYVFDELTFALSDYIEYNTDNKEYEVIMSAEDISDILNGKYIDKDNEENSIIFRLRRYNNEIPFYATKTPNKNRYMWRNVNGVGSRDNISLPEYPFANGYFYINQDINFYLKRQDPFNELGLYYYGNTDSIVPNDIYGNVSNPSEYEYKDESQATC